MLRQIRPQGLRSLHKTQMMIVAVQWSCAADGARQKGPTAHSKFRSPSFGSQLKGNRTDPGERGNVWRWNRDGTGDEVLGVARMYCMMPCARWKERPRRTLETLRGAFLATKGDSSTTWRSGDRYTDSWRL